LEKTQLGRTYLFKQHRRQNETLQITGSSEEKEGIRRKNSGGKKCLVPWGQQSNREKEQGRLVPIESREKPRETDLRKKKNVHSKKEYLKS